jgi:UDP-GlcNAc:undecaprenyl-phosphate GlcNAc-1-phosphate transferase
MRGLRRAVPLIRLARRWRLVDMPGAQPHKWHSDPTPLAGGPILALAVAAAYLLVVPPPGRASFGILLAAALMLVWGVWDDRATLPAWAKLVGQIAAAVILWYYGVQVRLFPLEWLNFLLSMLWIVGMINAFNFMDSMDGLALGLAAIGAAFFMLVTIDSGQPDLAYLCAAMAGAAIGVAFFNVSPAMMFIGDSGRSSGTAAGGDRLALRAGRAASACFLVHPDPGLGVPVFNITLVVASRPAAASGSTKLPSHHLAHRLVDLGLDRSRTVILIQLGAIALGLLAFIGLGLTPLSANILFGTVVAVGVGTIVVFEGRLRRAAE